MEHYTAEKGSSATDLSTWVGDRLYDHSETACIVDLRPSIGEMMRYFIGLLGVTFMGFR